jgi:hypothetical protein
MSANPFIKSLGLTLAGALAVTACSSSSSTPADTASSSSGGSSSGGSSTLYDRLGGHAGIRGAINAVVAAELMDADIKTYFFNQVATPVPAGHPSADQIEECLTDQLGAAAGGPETFPTTVVSPDDAGSFTCRDMSTIHQPLSISGGTFDKFVMIAGGVLTSAMGTGTYTYTMADIGTVAGVLTGAKPAIVSASLADAGSQPFPGASAH